MRGLSGPTKKTGTLWVRQKHRYISICEEKEKHI